MKKSFDISAADMDAAIRQSFALPGIHVPRIDIAATALHQAQKRQGMVVRHTKSLQRMNRVWRAMAGTATVLISGIFILGLLWGLSASSQTTTVSSAAESTTTAVARYSTVTVGLEWILLAAGLAIAWLIITNIIRAISTDTYEGVLA
jgi:uncharacterized membrane protein